MAARAAVALPLATATPTWAGSGIVSDEGADGASNDAAPEAGAACAQAGGELAEHAAAEEPKAAAAAFSAAAAKAAAAAALKPVTPRLKWSEAAAIQRRRRVSALHRDIPVQDSPAGRVHLQLLSSCPPAMRTRSAHAASAPLLKAAGLGGEEGGEVAAAEQGEAQGGEEGPCESVELAEAGATASLASTKAEEEEEEEERSGPADSMASTEEEGPAADTPPTPTASLTGAWAVPIVTSPAGAQATPIASPVGAQATPTAGAARTLASSLSTGALPRGPSPREGPASPAGARSLEPGSPLGPRSCEPAIVRLVDADTGKQRHVVTGPDGKVTAFGESTVDSILNSPEKSVERWLSGLTDLEMRGLVQAVGDQLLYSSQLYKMQQAELETLADEADRAFFGISAEATEKDLDNAYRRLARQMHPDKNGGTEEAKQNFQLMKERYEAFRARMGAPKRTSEDAPPTPAKVDNELAYDPSDRDSLQQALGTMLARLRPIKSSLDEIRRRHSPAQGPAALLKEEREPRRVADMPSV